MTKIWGLNKNIFRRLKNVLIFSCSYGFLGGDHLQKLRTLTYKFGKNYLFSKKIRFSAIYSRKTCSYSQIKNITFFSLEMFLKAI